VTLKAEPGKAVNVTLDRGRILLTHRKGAGAVAVRVRFLDQTWDLTLAEPGTEVALERIGQWPPGVPYEKEPRPDHRPVTDVYLLLLAGSARLGDGTEERTLNGTVVYQWNARQGVLGPVPLKKRPVWLSTGPTPPERDPTPQTATERLRQRLAPGANVANVLRAALDGQDREERVLAVHDAGAIDDLPLVLQALETPKHADLRAAAVATLRHWSARGAGQDQKLAAALVKEGYRPGQAAIVLQLLHTFAPPDLARPETYETLIDYLNHEKLSVRELASWHLTRLVPQGRTIGFDAAAPAEQRGRAVAAWRRLIPAGQLPPPPK
jgi:hypothetical protein